MKELLREALRVLTIDGSAIGLQERILYALNLPELTDAEIRAVYEKLWPGGPRVLESDIEFARAILAAQKAKQ